MLLNNKWVDKELKGEIKRYRETKENENTIQKSVGHRESNPEGNSQHYKSISKKSISRKSSNNLTLYLKGPEKKQQMKPKVSRRKEIIKIREEINEIESKNTTEKINDCQPRAGFFAKLNKIDTPLTRIIREERESK